MSTLAIVSRHFLEQTPAFGELSTEVLVALTHNTRPRTLASGQTLFSAGEGFHEKLYILGSGEIAVHRVDGRIYSPAVGSIIGLSCYLSGGPYTSTAVASTKVELLCISADVLRSLERRFPALADALDRTIVSALRERSVAQPPIYGVLAQPVQRIMGVPLVTCKTSASIADAFSIMEARDIGSIVVLADDGDLLGLATHRDLVAHLVRPGSDPKSDTVDQVCRPAPTVDVHTPIWRAEEQLQLEKTKYLVVMDGTAPLGMVSQTDITRALLSFHVSLHASIDALESLAELADHYGRVPEFASQALASSRHASDAVRSISEVHLSIQRRCVELTLAEMDKEGFGTNPISFALIIMGSGGRKEMLLNPDQDNGIILDDHPDADSHDVRRWFETFTSMLNINLDRVGYILCPGGIMARNPVFHKTLASWKRQTSKMIRRPTDKAARWSNIVFDFDTLFGDGQLAIDLRSHVYQALQEDPRLLQLMVEDDAQGRPALGWFNRLIATGEDGTVDLKRNGLRIIADAARILALRFGIAAGNTEDRVRGLIRHGVLSADFGATVLAAYEELLEIVLTHQLEQHRAGETLDKEVSPGDLSAPVREALRVAMRGVKRMQERLQNDVGVSTF